MACEPVMLCFEPAFLHQNGCRTRFPFLLHTFSVRIRAEFVDNEDGNSIDGLTITGRIPTIIRHGSRMPKRRVSPDQNLLVFPGPEPGVDSGIELDRSGVWTPPITTSVVPAIAEREPEISCDVVLSGTYRKGFETLRRTYEEFRDLGCKVLSPSNVSIVREHDGFVYMEGEETETPENIEDRHLSAIQKANFVWLHAPDGYVGPTAALEVGFANAAGVPVYARETPTDKVMQSFVRIVDSPATIVQAPIGHPVPPAPALRAFQEYYKRAAIQRGYTKEHPNDCLLLMVEEVGELARALRKREKLVRHGSYGSSNEAHELADVFLYVVHMANILGLDLSNIVREKEFINVEKFLAR
jgi:NTP pyrophosphatase (non-canonical NTP hydrolase)